MHTNPTISFAPKAAFNKTIANKKQKFNYYVLDEIALLKNKENEYISNDLLNPRLISSQSAVSNVDLDSQIIRNGQITDAIGRFITNEDGKIKYNEDGFPIIGVLDGLRRLDSCIRNNKPYSIMVGFFNDEEAQDIINSAVDAQEDLSCLELGFHISNIEQRFARTLETKELVEILGYSKSRALVSSARKAVKIHDKHPSLFGIFPVLSFVGKTTVNKLNEIVKFSENNLMIDELILFTKSNAFDYGHEEALLTGHDLINYDSKKNTLIINALAERVGFVKESVKSSSSVEINSYLSLSIKDNDKIKQRSEKLTIFEADLNDEERVLAERFLKVLTERNMDDNIDINEHFEVFFRRLEM